MSRRDMARRESSPRRVPVADVAARSISQDGPWRPRTGASLIASLGVSGPGKVLQQRFHLTEVRTLYQRVVHLQRALDLPPGIANRTPVSDLLRKRRQVLKEVPRVNPLLDLRPEHQQMFQIEDRTAGELMPPPSRKLFGPASKLALDASGQFVQGHVGMTGYVLRGVLGGVIH